MAYKKYNVRNVAELSYKALTQKTRQYLTATKKRIASLQKFDPENALAAKYKSLLDIDLRGGRAAKEKALIFASRYLNTKTGTVTGEKKYRAAMVKALREGSGGDLNIRPRDLKKFGDFMEAARALGLDELYGSDNIAETAKKSRFDIERSEFFDKAKAAGVTEFLDAYERWKK